MAPKFLSVNMESFNFKLIGNVHSRYDTNRSGIRKIKEQGKKGKEKYKRKIK